MVIGVDGNEANTDQRVGVHQYAYYLLWGLKKLNDKKAAKHHFKIFLKSEPRVDLPRGNKYWKYVVIPGKKIWILKNLTPRLFKERDLDIFFTPSHYLPPLPLSLPKVCTIHDIGYLRFSEQFKKYDFWQLKVWTAISIYISKYIISVSEFTKNDIVRHFPFASGKVFITHHGFDKQRFNRNISHTVVRRVLKKYGISDKKYYILFLSTLKPSKNVDGLVEAYKIIKKEFPNLLLVIAGKKGWFFNDTFNKVKKLNLEKDVIFTDFVSEQDKPALMKGAKVFVSASFWEGFGIHVLEAMACGTPVVVSRVASLPEVAGGAAIYVNPKSVKSIAIGIKKVINMSENEYNKLVFKVSDQSRKFSWQKSAKETMNIFEKISG